MKRSQFLALIPSIAAMPLIAREIIQDKEKVTIWKPEPVKIETPSHGKESLKNLSGRLE